MRVKLTERDTMLIDGRQSTLTGEYNFIGHIEGTNHFIVQCPDTGAFFIVPLHYSEVKVGVEECGY